VEATQLTLFKDRKYATIHRHEPHDHPWRVWQFYAKRATIEKNIRELLYDYPLAKIPTEDWLANVAFFHLLLFAFDIMHWFKRLCLPPAYLYATLDSVRTDFLVLPATLRKPAVATSWHCRRTITIRSNSRRHSRESTGSGSRPDSGVSFASTSRPRICTDAGFVSQGFSFVHY